MIAARPFRRPPTTFGLIASARALKMASSVAFFGNVNSKNEPRSRRSTRRRMLSSTAVNDERAMRELSTLRPVGVERPLTLRCAAGDDAIGVRLLVARCPARCPGCRTRRFEADTNRSSNRLVLPAAEELGRFRDRECSWSSRATVVLPAPGRPDEQRSSNN